MTYVDSYLQSKVMGADGVELITMLYDRAIVSLNIAKDSIMKGLDDPELVKKKAVELSRATDILYYLNDILDKQRGGQIAENLSLIYTTLAGELVKANLFNDTEIISKSIEILNNIKSAWEDVRNQLKEKQNEPKRTFAGAV
ncbi:MULTISPECIES: flagellar export chaperone FliS [Thermodesulfovibrio]|jgi:flagellar protein FliS|uniref:Flagellar secretion chaperone FliS n=1 Tax=Thermodesulfovibrio yellowstonii (strain ATCC 51303 / DSM 11347 / YP87) TaxID=289376 RepID=B5YGA8_THEYD|nr:MULTISPECIES: flagellar export chaperone FliS [Thermodesulfovibrio]ACI21507.1 flagellar protein FliS [Thermodesulfovibrio yellowstonii DSM 11347]